MLTLRSIKTKLLLSVLPVVALGVVAMTIVAVSKVTSAGRSARS